MADEGLKLIILRNAFYRDSYRRVVIALFVVLGINCILGFMIFYKWTNPPTPQYFATTADGRIIMLHKLTDPVVTDDFIVQWATNAVRGAFSLDYIHWREQLEQAANNFTPEGWKYFLNSLRNSNNLKTLTSLKMVSNVTVTAAPQVVEKEIVGGHFAWKVEMPLLITYESAEHTIHMPVNVTLIVIRMPVQNYPQRVAINNFLAGSINPDVLGKGVSQ